MSFSRILEKYRTISFSERDKGNQFERLMKAFLLTYPQQMVAKFDYQTSLICAWADLLICKF